MALKETLYLPKNALGEIEIPVCGSVVFIGANGSGKSRLGSWIDIESPQKKRVHRVSAQKSLSMPDTTTPVSIELAEKDLRYGYSAAPIESASDYKIGHKWHSRPAVTLQDDFNKLMTYLFSEHTEISSKYLQDSKVSRKKINPPTTKIETVKKIWEMILPHRELIIGGLRVRTKIKNDGDTEYNASEMSDGERVVFYLIGQCLSASENSIIVIDEPELHLQKAIQGPLWNAIENSRPDCIFSYFTHDVEFASTRVNATKIWVKSFDGSKWDWEVIRSNTNIPEELLLLILGNRKPVLFVEGTNSSYDVVFYRSLLRNYFIIPIGSCIDVINSVKSLRLNDHLHHLKIFGLVDRDRRGDIEIQALEKEGIYTLNVAEVENLFCTEELLRYVSKKLARDPDTDFRKASKHIKDSLLAELENQVSLKVINEVKFMMNLFNQKSIGLINIQASLSDLVTSISIDKLYKNIHEEFDIAIKSNDYKMILKMYNRKSLSSQICKYFGFNNCELAEYVLRLASGSEYIEILNCIKQYFGNFKKLI